MGVELLEIGVKLRKGVIFTIRGCFRSVCNHPFLVGMLCFLIFLYRSSPFIFSLLVSSSPILVCTAVLLGTLLSFGQPNIPEIEVEEKTTHDAVAIKTGMSGDATVVEKNESYYVERFSEERRDEVEQSTEQLDLSAGKLGEVCKEDRSDDTAPLIDERSWEIELEDGETWVADRELGDLRHKEKSGWNEERLSDGEVVENQYAPIAQADDELGSDDEKSEADSFDSETVNVDSLDSPPRSPWKREDKEEEVEEEEEDDALDSGSDRAESSSPDASMADIMPMLDELHPLLDEEAPQPVDMSHGGSDAASERSRKSSTSSHESDDDAENHEDLEVADDDNEDGEDEEDAQEDKEEQTKSAITWTEEDQKNLMDLGSSEIERNQRLENLILRRRARKNMSVFPERNLIDLESSDLPFNITPISTRRQNPFDLPNDSYDNLGLPPIPGSAPSVLAQRRNPFDIPYDSSEEKPDLMGDGFQEEFTTFQSREPFFRRHESFNLRPSIFAPNRQDVKMRPYFVPERTISEESSYSPFQRQSSELSDSKVSSVPETESVVSVEDMEDKKLSEEHNRQEVEAIPKMKEVTDEGPSEDPMLISRQEEVTEEDVHHEPELISKMESVSEYIGHGSQSSEEEESSELSQVEKRDVKIDDLEFQLGDVVDHYQQGSVTRPVEIQATEYHSNSEAVEQRYSRISSSSSLSEVSERVFTETEGEGLSMFDGRRDGVAEEPGVSTQTSVETTDLSISSTLVNDIPQREPVYDSSPREIGKSLSSSSISSDVHPESGLGLPPVLVKRTLSFIEGESEGSGHEIETDISRNIEMLQESSNGDRVDDHDNVNTDFSGVDQISESEGSSAAPGIISHVSVPLQSSIEASEEENLVEPHKWDEVPSSSSDKDIHTLVKSFEDQNLEDQLREEHSIGMEETVQSPNSDDVYDEAGEKLISTPSDEGNTSLFYDKAIREPIFKHLDELQVSSAPIVLSEDVPTAPTSNMPEIQELDYDISSNVNSSLSPDFISTPSSSSETNISHVDVQRIVEEADEIKEIDEGLLSELDSVGDFSIKQWESGLSELEKHVDFVGEAETSSMQVVEVNSIENEIEDAMHSKNLREDMEYISELQTSKTGIAEHIDVSKVEFNERHGQGSPDQETSEDKTLSKENEAQPAFVVNHNSEDNISTMPEVELQSIEDADSVPKKAEVTYVETTYEMPELEASTIEDIDLAFKQIGTNENEKSVILEPPQEELIIRETIAEKAEDETLHRDYGEVSHQAHVDTDDTSGMPELEASKIEDIDLAFKQIEKPVVFEPPQAELVIRETITTSEMPELEASTFEDIHLAFKQISGNEIKKPIVLEPPQEEPVVGEAITEHSEDGTQHRDSSVTGSTRETSILEVRQIEDPIPSEGPTSYGDSEKQLKLNSDDGSVEVKADKQGSPMEEPRVTEISAFAAEKPSQEVEAAKDLQSSKGKGKISKSSSSSSSSSSESSDSDRE